MNKQTDFMGLNLKNVIMTAAGPWAGNAEGIQRCVDAGAAAVITETISLEARPRISPRLFAQDDQLFNIMLYSPLHLEEWEEELRMVDRKDAKIICSIWGATASEIAYLSKKVEQMRADAIEISISAPIGTRNQILTRLSPDISSYFRAAVEAVKIPVMVKLSYEASTSPDFLLALEQAGVRSVSAIDALKGLEGVDVENRRTLMPAYGGYTGDRIRPVALATAAALHQYTPMQVASSGGVLNHINVLEFLMLGATAVQLATAIQIHGYDVISEVLNNLDDWLLQHGIDDIEAIRGSALPSLRAFEDIVPRSLFVSPLENCRRTECMICSQCCLCDAVFLDDRGLIAIDPNRCDGCGLCVARCPHQLLQLGWR